MKKIKVTNKVAGYPQFKVGGIYVTEAEVDLTKLKHPAISPAFAELLVASNLAEIVLKNEVWIPKNGDEVWMYGGDSAPMRITYYEVVWQQTALERGEIFPTKEACIASDAHLRREKRLKDWVKANGGCEFVADNNNYSPYLNTKNGELGIFSFYKNQHLPNWMYLPTREACERFIKECGEDLLKWFNYKG